MNVRMIIKKSSWWRHKEINHGVFKRTPHFRGKNMDELLETTQETLEELDIFNGEEIELD